jgi:ABC-type transport system substrate-binding protein
MSAAVVTLADRIEPWPIDRLRPYERDPRTHSDAQVDQIAASMVEFGWTNPVLVDEQGGILAGHGRPLATRKLGFADVPVIQYNMTGYANPRVDALLDKIKGEMVTYARDAYLEEARRIVTGDLVSLPIRHEVSVFVMRKDLDIPPDPWDVPRFRLARFTAPNG